MINRKTICSLFLLLFLLFAPCTGLAHTLTEEQVNKIDSYLTTLEQNNNKLETNSKKSSEDLQKVSVTLDRVDKTLATVELRLTKLETVSNQMAASTEKTEKLYKGLEISYKKQKAENKILWIVVGALAADKLLN